MAKVIWMTGLSGSGKSTIAEKIRKLIKPLVILDGDVVRSGLCKDLGFSLEDRNNNIKRIAYVSKIIVDSGIDVIVPAITPTEESRKIARKIVGDNFFLLWVKCPLEVCECRDVKGLYKKARNGEIKNFTGIGSPFEMPERYDCVCDTSINNLDDSIDIIIKNLDFRAGVSN